MTAQKRPEILRQHAEALAAYARAMDAMLRTARYSTDERKALVDANRYIQKAQALEDEYHRILPRVAMSICPFDDLPLVRTFDPHGLDGPWWRPDASPEEPQACRHFCVLVGALDLAGYPPRAGGFEVHPGPQAPFVIPRILGLDGVTAVISRLEMDDGYDAYPIAYFAERRPPPQDLTASWVRTDYLYTTQLGEVAWRIPNDPWDFELAPWLASGKLRWTEGEGPSMRLVSGQDWPYARLRGERRPAVLQRDRIWFEAPPDGSVVRPMS